MVAFWRVPVGPGGKFLLVVLVGVPACLLAGYAVTRLPGACQVV